MRINLLKRKINRYLIKEQLLKDRSYAGLKNAYLTKARKNILIANLLMKISEDKKTKDFLKLPDDFNLYEWVIIVSYYAMYSAALGALANFNYKSRSHAATVVVLRYHYVHRQRLGREDILRLEKARKFSEALIGKLIKIKSRRESAQYDATPSISKVNAETSVRDANEFVGKVEEIMQT